MNVFFVGLYGDTATGNVTFGHCSENRLRPVYTLRFVGPICRPDSVGAQIVRVF